MTDGNDLSAVVIALGPERVVRRACTAAKALPSGAEVVVVHGYASNQDAERRIGGELARSGVRFLAFLGTTGAAWNAGIRTTSGSLVALIDGSEEIRAGAIQAMASTLAADPLAAVALADGHLQADASTSDRRITLPEILGGDGRFASTRVIRRSGFELVGGFDDNLATLADWDLLIAVAERGGPILVVAGADIVRYEDDVHRREALRAERYLPSIRRIVEKHRQTFASVLGAAFGEREHVARALWERERDAIATHQALRTRLQSAIGDLDRLRNELAPFRRQTLEWNDLRRPSPLSRNWGSDRGRPIDRHYIDAFLATHDADVHGVILEMLDDDRTRALGGDRVVRADILDIDAGNHRATIIGDLRSIPQIPSDTYDCFILTQTIHLIDDIDATIAEAHRVLKPGGVLLVTLPTASMVATEYGEGGDHWRVTAAGARRLFERRFATASLDIGSRGNVLTTTAFLYGLSCEEMTAGELDVDDPAYPTVITVRAVKAGRSAAVRARGQSGASILLYHRIASARPDVHALCVRPEVFEDQVAQIARDWQPITLRSLAEAVVNGNLPERAVAVTFDDGYLDNLIVAAPLLERHAVPATFFLTSESLDSTRTYWWDILEQTLLSEALPGELMVRIAGEVRGFVTATAAQRQLAHDQLHAILRSCAPVVRDDIVHQLQLGRPIALDDSCRPVTRAEITRVAALDHIEIGAHSVHHLALPDVSADAAAREIFDSRGDLERVIARTITQFAYPFGHVSEPVVATTAAAGFDIAVTCDARGVRAGDHPLKLPRRQVPNLTGTAFGRWLEEIDG